MSRKINYFNIGLFIIIGIIILVVGLIVFGGGDLFKKKLVVETYFDGSVQGLNVGSPIKFRGVKIGEVTNMSLVGEVYDVSKDIPDSYKYNLYVFVQADLYIEHFERFSVRDEAGQVRTMKKRVKEAGLRCKLVPLGITGGAYLELDFVDPKFWGEPLEIVWEPKTIYIPSVPSTIAQVIEALAKIPEVLDKQVYPTLENVNEASQNLNLALETLDEVLINTLSISDNIRDVSLELKENPSRILFGDAPPKKGVKR
jgi:hypothetical protein